MDPTEDYIVDPNLDGDNSEAPASTGLPVIILTRHNWAPTPFPEEFVDEQLESCRRFLTGDAPEFSIPWTTGPPPPQSDMATGEAEDERDEVADATTHADQPVNEPQTQTQAYQEPEHESEPEALRCRICDDPAPEGEALIFINCGHTFCSGCLNECFRVGLSNKASFPPKCCENEGIDVATVAGFLEEELVIRYTMVEEEFRTRSPLYCATPRCSALISGARVANAVGKFIDCHECGQASCIDCKSSRSRHTEAKCPDFIDKEDRDLVNEKKWKQCPGCKNLVEREDGCNHMTCECGTEFCYECGIEFADDNSCGCYTLPDDEGWHHPVAADDDRDFDIDGNPIEASDVEDSDEP